MNHQRAFFWILGLFVLAAIVIFVAVLFIARDTQDPLDTYGDPVTLPVGDPVLIPGSGNATTSEAKAIEIPSSEGNPIITNDFINAPSTKIDSSNEGRYLLAGDLGYCISNPESCRAGPVTDYNIYYDSQTQSFTIALLVEPIGETRRAAEQFLMDTLGITADQMCALRYYVGTTQDVNSRFDGKNLGFSFCPGATKLPE